MPQKPPDLDDSGKPLSVKPPDLGDDGKEIKSEPDVDELIAQAKLSLAPTSNFNPPTPVAETPKADEGWLSRAWHTISDPLTDKPSRMAKEFADSVDSPSLDRTPDDAYWAGLKAGIAQGMGDIASGLTSPLNIATTALTAGSGMAGKAGLSGIASALSTAGKVAAAPTIAHGAINTLHPDSSLTERGFGIAEMAGGASAMMHTPTITKPTEIAPKANFAFHQPDFEGGGIPMYNVDMEGHPLHRSTVSAETLGENGIPVPETPTFDPNVRPVKPGMPANVEREFMQSGPIKTNNADFGDQVLDASGRPLAPMQGNEVLPSRESGPWDRNIPQEVVNPTTGELLPQPGPAQVAPMFNRKGKTGETGNAQDMIARGEATVETIKAKIEAGFKFTGLDKDGNFQFTQGGSGKAPILETEVGTNRPTASASRQQLGPLADTKKSSVMAEVMNFPRAIMASIDMSAPLRQGLGLIHKKEFWTSIDDMFKAFGSEKAFNDIQASISEKPLFKTREINGKPAPSFAEEAGLKLSDLTDLSKREEAIMSTWAEKVPGVRRSNRAYTAFLNKLRADTFENLVNSGKIFGSDASVNVPLARGLADFVNTATGRGSLGKLEQSAVALNSAFFAPRLIASRLKMLNPNYYIMAEPMVRKEALKSLLAIAGTGTAIGQLAKMSGMGKVESDATSSDFGKIKIGSVRIDPYAGFQQYIVAANRLIQGKTKSTTTGNTYNLGEKFGRSTRLDVVGRFAESKLNPTMSFVTGMLRGKDFTGQPFNVPEEVASRFIPIFLQDLKQLATENPDLIPGYSPDAYKEFHPENLPFAVPAFFGAGVQQYKSR